MYPLKVKVVISYLIGIVIPLFLTNYIGSLFSSVAATLKNLSKD